MAINHFGNWTASQIANAVRQRQVSPVEVVTAYLQSIEQLNPALNAFVELRGERCLNEAKLAEAAIMRGEQLGFLQGVPTSIKSCIAVAGCKQEAGSPTRKGIVAKQDAPLVTRLKKAGAIVLGTTNTPEMLMAYDTENPIYGRTNSPWDLERTPGGSSGGESAAIASGMSVAGVGSDGGGSIRVPAHFTGICGLKPTPGRIPATGHFPESFGPFAMLGVVGPMARSVEDLKLMFRVMAGPDLGDTFAAPAPVRNLSQPELRKVRIGFMEQHADCPATSETKLAIRAAVSALQLQGFEVEPFTPTVLTEAREHWWTLFVRLAGELILPIFEGREEETSSIMQYARFEPPPTKQDLLDAWFGRDQLRIRLFQEMERFPVLITPVCAIPAPKHGERKWEIDGCEVDYMQAMMYTQWFNLLGIPAVVVPVGTSPEGLPIGVQIVGLPYAEELILEIASCIESCFPAPRPPMQHRAEVELNPA
jgi:amidase